MASRLLTLLASVCLPGALIASCTPTVDEELAPQKMGVTTKALTCPSADPGHWVFHISNGDLVNPNLADYGDFFFDAQNDTCAPDAAHALRLKIESTLASPATDGVTGISAPYQRWLEGGMVSLIFTTALELGAKGRLDSDLAASLLRVRGAFNFNVDPSCGVAVNQGLGNSCMDDYSVGATGYAWISAYDAYRGWYQDASMMANSARTLVSAALSTYKSICIHDDDPAYQNYTGRGVCNVNIDANATAQRNRLNAGTSKLVSFNHGFQNLGYGIGLMTSISSAAVGLQTAGQALQLTDYERDVARALFREAQLHTSCDGGAFDSAGCYTTDGYTLSPNHTCFDMGYAPKMFPVAAFYGDFLGGAPSINCPTNGAIPAYGFNVADNNPATYASLTQGRRAIYVNLAYFWLGSVGARPPLGAPIQRLPRACLAEPPVGAGNSNANNAGYDDNLCGYYKYAYGYDYGYCGQASAYASSAGGISLTATGTCVAGTLYNYYAGYYDSLCRYYEYLGYGWDYGGSCFWSNYYAANGRCTDCGTCTPSCSGKWCGQSDGCGGTCCNGSGCAVVGCYACMTPNSCGGQCVPVANGTPCGSGGICQNGTCQTSTPGTAHAIWIQPQWRAGFGPPGSLVVAGSAQYCTQGVELWYALGTGYWQKVPYTAPVGSDGIWYNSIENASFTQTYNTYVKCAGGPASYCTYDGRNDIVWCP